MRFQARLIRTARAETTRCIRPLTLLLMHCTRVCARGADRPIAGPPLKSHASMRVDLHPKTRVSTARDSSPMPSRLVRCPFQQACTTKTVATQSRDKKMVVLPKAKMLFVKPGFSQKVKICRRIHDRISSLSPTRAQSNRPYDGADFAKTPRKHNLKKLLGTLVKHGDTSPRSP